MSEVTAPCLTNIWNTQIIKEKTSSDNLKLADFAPVFEKDDCNLRKNYRSASALPVVSKIFERQLQKKIKKSYIDQFLSKFLCGYRKGYSSQTSLTLMLEEWKKTLILRDMLVQFFWILVRLPIQLTMN